jgi:hypothetical protein
MRATVMHAAGDVRIENIPDATIIELTDALIRVTPLMSAMATTSARGRRTAGQNARRTTPHRYRPATDRYKINVN